MTSTPTMAPSEDPAGTADATRFRLRPPSALTGHVDGGWWPRSRDLAAELPELLTGIASRMEPVGRISYHPDDWDPAPRKLVTETHVVRLGWYRLLPAGTVDVISGPRRITLLVVPPQTPEDTARSVLERAADPTNTDVVATTPGDTGNTHREARS